MNELKLMRSFYLSLQCDNEFEMITGPLILIFECFGSFLFTFSYFNFVSFSCLFLIDSAAGATAFACGKKTYNAGIAVDAAGQPIGTLLEAAIAKGYKTGVVAKSRLSHATPAAFTAHVQKRKEKERKREKEAEHKDKHN